MHDGALETLRTYFGYESFRPGQERMVSAILDGRDALGIMPTGAGKSVCYQVPALMLPGITFVVSPLVSLMGDQVRALKAAGARPSYLNSTLTPAQQNTVLRRAAEGQYQIMYVAPERLADPRFLAFARGAVPLPAGSASRSSPWTRRTASPNGGRISVRPTCRWPSSSRFCRSVPSWPPSPRPRPTACARTSSRCCASARPRPWSPASIARTCPSASRSSPIGRMPAGSRGT